MMTLREKWIVVVLWILFFNLFLPVLGGNVYGKKTIPFQKDVAPHSAAGKMENDPSRLRETFKSGILALKNDHPLIARLMLDGLEKDYPILGDYILSSLIRSELATDDPAVALKHTDQFLDDYPQSVLIPSVLVARVKACLALKHYAQAEAVARDLLKKEPTRELVLETNLLLGEALEGQKKWEDAYDLYLQFAYQFPETEEGAEAEQKRLGLADKTEAGKQVPDASLFLTKARALQQALQQDRVIEVCEEMAQHYPQGIPTDQALLLEGGALIKTGQFDEGIRLLNRVSKTAGASSLQAEALYRVGKAYWNHQQNSRAKKVFRRVLKRYPKSEWSLKALYALGRIYEAAKNVSKARQYYLRIGRINPRHDLASAAAWQAGWAEFEAGNYRKAREAFTSCRKKYPDSDVFTATLYWEGRSDEKLKNPEEAQRIFQLLAQEHGWDFYGVMARKRLNSSWNFVPEPQRGDDPDCTDEGLPLGDPSLTFHLDRAEELIQIGFSAEAKGEIDALAAATGSGAEGACYIGKLYEKSSNFNDSVRWMYRVSLNHDGASLGEDLTLFKKYLYPLAYWKTVSKEAALYGLDPFLILAVMRQESLFEDDIVSPADARGLMQIIPSTGESIAQRLGIETFIPETLFEPETNVAFGSWYLHSLMERSNGDLVRVLSSYNAGETRSDQWWDRTKDLDVDERIESISFRETRGYVKKVLRNLENYNRLYGRLRQESSRAE